MGDVETTRWILCAREGQDEAWDRLHERLAPRLHALIRIRMGGGLRARLESRDILQNVLLKAFRHIEQFSETGTTSLMGWMARIAENEIRDAADYHARQRRDAAREVAVDAGGDDLAYRVRSQVSHLILSQRWAQVERALDRLEPVHRDVILLRKLEQLEFGAIAERLGRSPDACRMLLARALTRLTLALEEHP